VVIDSIGQQGVDPGTEWGTGLTSTMDNTLRRKPTIEAGDTNPTDAFDPAAEWDGFANDTFDGLGGHLTAVLTCAALRTPAGTAATRTVSATDPDDTVVDLAITDVNPVPAAGTITRTAFSPATTTGGIATADITVDSAVPAGTYAVTITSTDTDGTTEACTLTVQVTIVLTVGEVQGQTLDSEDGKTDRSPLAPPTGSARPTATCSPLMASSSS
jgi:hypothetical protein